MLVYKRYLARLELDRIKKHDAGRMARRNLLRRRQILADRLHKQRKVNVMQTAPTVVDLYLQASRVRPVFENWIRRLGQHISQTFAAEKVNPCAAVYADASLKPLSRIVEQVVIATTSMSSTVIPPVTEQDESRAQKSQREQDEKSRKMAAAAVAYGSAVGKIRDVVRGRLVMKSIKSIAVVIGHLQTLHARGRRKLSGSSPNGDNDTRDGIIIADIVDRFAQTGNRRYATDAGWRDVTFYIRLVDCDDQDREHICELQVCWWIQNGQNG